jgi:hypothetical protein
MVQRRWGGVAVRRTAYLFLPLNAHLPARISTSPRDRVLFPFFPPKHPQSFAELTLDGFTISTSSLVPSIQHRLAIWLFRSSSAAAAYGPGQAADGSNIDTDIYANVRI